MTYPLIASPLVAAIVSVMVWTVIMWPPKTPYVTLNGSTVHESIWVWRIPAYVDHPAWRVRWSIWDGLKARAYCYDPERAAQYRLSQ